MKYQNFVPFVNANMHIQIILDPLYRCPFMSTSPWLDLRVIFVKNVSISRSFRGRVIFSTIAVTYVRGRHTTEFVYLVFIFSSVLRIDRVDAIAENP